MNYTGTIIEESLSDKSVLDAIKITNTTVEKVTDSHKTPWIEQWTLHKFELPESKAEQFALELSTSLDKNHSWYADFRNNLNHYIIFTGKVFCVEFSKPESYKEVKEYGLRLGIPDYQLDFHPEIEQWER